MVSLQYDHDNDLAIFTARGTLSLKEVVEAALKWSQHESYTNTSNVMWDLIECDWHPVVKEFLLMADEVTRRVNQIWDGDKVAWLVHSRTEVALVETHLATVGWQATWRAFTQKSEALDWLKEDIQNGATKTC